MRKNHTKTTVMGLNGVAKVHVKCYNTPITGYVVGVFVYKEANCMTIEEMKRRKKELGYSNKKLAEVSGVPIGTVQKVFSGETASPRYDTIQALTKALTAELSDTAYNVEDVWEVHEPEPAYSIDYTDRKMVHGKSADDRKKICDNVADKTIDDYIALPEGTRVELIDGKFYNMAAPTTIHQRIAPEIWRILKNHIQSNNGPCIPFIAPTDVQLDCDNKTMVQPDVFIVCDRSKLTKARIVGAPDFVVEIASPGNTFMDVTIKLFKYKNAGVREYWIVFPDDKGIVVYDLEKGFEPKIYSFDDKVPVGIWNGECEVDFKEIYSQIEFMYDLV